VLQVRDLVKYFGPTPVLDGVSFVVNDGERVGLIGANGAGKSTLLRCLAGLEPPDAGSVVLGPPGASIGYLPQLLPAAERGQTVATALRAAQADFVHAEAALQQAADRLAAPPGPETEQCLAEYDAALARFEALGGYAREHRADAVRDGLGLGPGRVPPDTPVAALSGGQKTRLGLATLLLREPTLLLLDEPSNHLDIDALEWLEGFLLAYPGGSVVVSHDRELLDRTVERILYLDPESHGMRSYPGDYSAFAAARAQERQQQLAAWRQQHEYVERVERDVSRLKSQARSIERSTTPREPGVRKLARKKARVALAREHKLERYLESAERVDKPRQGWPLNLDFGTPPPGGRLVLGLARVDVAYPNGPPLLEGVTFDVQHGQRVALVGPNGAGKTTLLRVIAGELEPTRGQVRLGAAVRLGVLAQEQETLDPSSTVLDTVVRERPMPEPEARRLLSFFLFYGDAVRRRVGDCSLGEQTRLQLAGLVLRGCNLLLLDEPLNHLDVDGREHFLRALDAYRGTVIAVAHDRAFLRAFADRVVEVRDGRTRVFEGGYAAFTRRLS
jgi:ATP-binding cassette, subfamily F, member 3